LQPRQGSILTAANSYHQNWYIQTAGFPNGSIFIPSQTRGALLCARSGEKTALAQSSPLYRSQGHVSRRGAQARIAWRNAPRERWKRNGGEHAWSFLRISRAFDLSSTKRRCPGCIGCEQTAAKRDGRPKNVSADTALSNVDISYDLSSRWQKLAAVPDEIFEREVQDKTHMPTTAGLIRAAAERGHAGAPDHKAPALGRGDARVFIGLGRKSTSDRAAGRRAGVPHPPLRS
jgi:hypothetical protein